MAHANEVQEMGLLSYNYEVDDPTGQIDGTIVNDGPKVKDPHKEPMISPKGQTKPQDLAPPPPTKTTQCQKFCMSVFYWIPIRTLCLCGNIALFVCPFLDDKFNQPSAIEWMLGWYVQAFAIVGLFIESPTWWLTKRVQLTVFHWARFLRRTSGRAGFYLTVATITFAGVHEHTTVTMFAGIYMVFVSCIMLLFSGLAAKQLHIMFDYMSSNAMDANKGEMALPQRIESYYHQVDREKGQKIGATHLYQFGEQVLKRKLSNSERYTIQLYLDQSCNGYITPEDWTKQFMRSNRVKML